MRHPAAAVLRYVGLSRSTYYRQAGIIDRPRVPRGGRPAPGCSRTVYGGRVADDQVKEYVRELIRGDGFYYGYHKLTHALRREYRLVINKKKVYRLCKEMDVLRPQRQKRAQHPRKLARNRVVTGPNQLWETDVKYGYVAGEDRFFYVASVLDVFDRSVVGYHMGLNCEGQNVLGVVKDALAERKHAGHSLILRSDNGPQFKSNTLRTGCEKLGIEQEYIPFKTPNLNAHIESFHAILEAECLSGQFRSYAEALTDVRRYMEFYNKRRLHSGCGYRPPMEYYLAVLGGQPARREIRL
jgi:putative transposase